MEFVLQKIQWLIDFIFVHPKSTETLLFFLIIIFIIALIVNRHRDATGRVSFIDRSKTGVTGLCIYAAKEGQRIKNWLIPLWIPEKNLLLTIKLILPKGQYDIKAFWKEDSAYFINHNIFEAIPVDAGNFSSISGVGRFNLEKNMVLEFNLRASNKQIQINCPENKSSDFEPVKTPFPLQVADSSYKKFADRFEKEKKKKILELLIFDNRIISGLENQIKSMQRKLDQVTIQYKDIESDMDEIMAKYKKLHQNIAVKQD